MVQRVSQLQAVENEMELLPIFDQISVYSMKFTSFWRIFYDFSEVRSLKKGAGLVIFNGLWLKLFWNVYLKLTGDCFQPFRVSKSLWGCEK